MGSKKKKRALKPPTPPPPVETIQAESISPTLRQEAARRQRKGAYATKGQRIGAGGEVLGAGPMQLARIGAKQTFEEKERTSGTRTYYTGFGDDKKLERGFKGAELEALKKAGYKTTTYQVKRRRSHFGGHRTKTMEHITYDDYIKQYNQRVAQQRTREAGKTGMTI